MNKKLITALVTAGLLSVPLTSHALIEFTTEDGSIKTDIVSTIGIGFGYRLKAMDPALNGEPGSPNEVQWGDGYYGDRNYGQHQLFSAQIKGTHEVLTDYSSGFKSMVRATYMYDPAAEKNISYVDFTDAARNQIARDFRLLDAWISKDFEINGNKARWRFGNQVQNWGESLYAVGGISQTNSLDYQKLAIPGTLLKEAVIPAPMFSFGSSFGNGFTFDSYYQFRWNRNVVPPVGSYFSYNNLFGQGAQYYDNPQSVFAGPGADAYLARVLYGGGRVSQAQLLSAFKSLGQITLDPAYGYVNSYLGTVQSPKNSGQYGLSLHYRPEGLSLDLGAYVMNYHDKAPVLNFITTPGSSITQNSFQYAFLEDRKMYGLSANFPVGAVAVGWELSYRPKDAVELGYCGASPDSARAALADAVGVTNCPGYKDYERYQSHLTQQIYIEPSLWQGAGGTILNLLGGATSAIFTAEEVGVYMPGFDANNPINTAPGVYQMVDAGYAFWHNSAFTGGTNFSWGYTLDFNWTYDGSVIKGWQLTPGATFYDSVKGDTPDVNANFFHGARAVNMYLLFNQSPGPSGRNWSAGLNYTMYFGGDDLRQPYSDRDFVGGFVQYNF
jgi:Protein of unknown function (DUF1302)